PISGTLSMTPFTRTALAGAAVGLAWLPIAANAQPAIAENVGELLPPIVVEQKPWSQPAAKAPKKSSANDAAKKPPSKDTQAAAQPLQDSAAAARIAVEQMPRLELVNPGSPSATVVPVAGLAGNPGAQTVTGIERDRFKNDPVFSAGDILKES